MIDLGLITPHARIVGADGIDVGIVRHVDGDLIALVESDREHAPLRHISGAVVAGVEDGAVRLNVNAGDVVLLEREDTTYQH